MYCYQKTITVQNNKYNLFKMTTTNLQLRVWPKILRESFHTANRSCSNVKVSWCKNFQSCSNQNSVILIQSSELASFFVMCNRKNEKTYFYFMFNDWQKKLRNAIKGDCWSKYTISYGKPGNPVTWIDDWTSNKKC